ncbi:M23 family metallopeptidase [Lichenibacterium minor]|uniref:M23 family metallopeptidase n=1 Tax=Lichenibacterium minor TaxID=2316528 RepID=A0A4Q2U4P2_9HYPH|nr:M23 family metallopeptidase [Lichenibacterium minor]
MKPFTVLLALAAAWLFPAPGRAEVVLDWPVACSVGKTCEIQHYVDHGGGGDAKDFRCGTVTYKGHNGTDIRVLTMADERRGVDILAAAPGRVLRVRDGMDDVSVAVLGHDAIKDRDCGNAVIIAHADGFQTDYCHMAKGSVAVKPGDSVKVDQVIGRVGLSGDTEFPHLHITVRHDGRVVDPFAYGQPEGACAGGTSLWRADLQPSLAYKNGTVLNFGLAPTAVTVEQVDDGAGRDPLAPDSPAVLAYVRAIDLRRGDIQRLVVTGPGGVLVDRSEPPLPSNKDQVFMGIGRRRPPGGWGPGIYAAHYTVTRDGAAVVDRSVETRIGSAPTGPSGP